MGIKLFKINNLHNLFVLFILSALFNFPLDLKSQQVSDTIPYTSKVKYYKNGKIRSCYLSKDYVFLNYNLPCGSALFFLESGKLFMCEITKETSFNGLVLPPKATVFFKKMGENISFWLPDKTRIQGIFLAANSDGVGHSIYKNGQLKSIWLAKDQEIDGVPCSTSGNIFKYGFKVMGLGTKRMVWLYDNGKIQQAMISRDVNIQGVDFKKGDIICFDKQGKIDTASKLLE